MAGMDRVFDGLQLDQLVTMVYAVADPALDQLAVINAGHPPPAAGAPPTASVELLEHPSTLLLGVGGGDRAVLETDLRPGDRLLLYTDGLVERRDEDADTGTARLVKALLLDRPGTLDENLLDASSRRCATPPATTTSPRCWWCGRGSRPAPGSRT